MNQKKRLGRKVISYVLALVMVFSTFTGIVPGTSLTAKADESYPQTYKIVFTSKGNPSQRTWKEDTTLPQTIAGSTVRSYMRYAGACDHIDLISGNNVSIDGTNISINGEGTSTVNVYKTSTSYAPFGIVVTKNITAIATGYTGTFDNDEHGVSVDVKVPSSGYTIKYGTQSGTYDLEESPKYENAGNYTVYYQVTADGYNTKTGSVLVSIAKATPTINTQPVASAIYYGQSLADSSLSNGTASVPGTFAWKDNTIQPDVTDSDQTEYEVVFTPEDTANYNTVSCNVKLTVNKADPDVTDPTGLTATYGQILEDVTLPEVTDGTWSFDDPQTSVGNVGTNEFAATYTPTDTTRYKIKHTNLSVTVGEVDKTALDNAISLAETYYNQIKDNTDYTDIVNSLNSAIDAAKAVKNNPNVTSETVAEAVTTMNTAVDDTKAAEAVIAKIIDLPAAEDVKHTDVDAIHEARAAYDKLTDSQKGMINETITQKLKDCEEALINKIATAIENIEKVTRDNKDDVRTLLDSYDKLYDTEKDAVDKKLGRAGTKKISDLEEVLEVTEKIENLADPDNIDLTDEKAITLARTAYELLSDSQKALVSDEILSKLTAAEEKFASVKAQDSLATAKTSATERLEDYADAKALADANDDEKATYNKAVNEGKKAIADAETKEDVAQAITAAKAAVDAALAKINEDRAAAKAAAEKMAAADKALEDADAAAEEAKKAAEEATEDPYASDEDKAAISTAKEALDDAVEAADALPVDATAEQKEEAAKAIADAAAELDAVVDTANVNSAAAKAEAEKLAAAKTSATERLEDYAAAKAKSDATEAEKKAYDDVVAAEMEKINAATDKEAVADALTKAKAAVDAALAKIDNDRATAAAAKKAMAEADKAVADAKTSAETVNTAANEAVSNEYVSESDKQAIEDAKEAVDVAVKAANKLSETATAVEKNEAAKAIEDAVKTLNEAVDNANINSAAAKAEAEEAKAAAEKLAAAKTSATERLEDYAAAKAKSDATEAEKKAYDDVVAAEMEKINAATDKEAVADALTKAKAAVDAALAKIDNDRATAAAAKKAMAEADKAVADAKTSAETANTAANEAVSNEYVSESDKQAIEDAKEAVDVAVKAANDLSETATAVEKNEAAKAIEDAVKALNEAVDKANINSAAAKAEAEEAKIAAEKLAAAKNNAKDRLEDVYDSKNKSDYREAQQKELEEAKKAGDKAIDAAMTSNDAIKELEAAKVALNAVKTNDQLTREEKAAADAAAAKAAAEKLAESKAKEANAVSLSAKLKVSQTGKKLNISWGAVKDAEEYGVFVQYNGKSFPETATVTVKSGKTKVSIKKLNEKALNLKKSYKVYVVAYRTVNGKKTVVGKSIIANVAGKQNTKYSNPEKLTIKSAKSVTLNIGKASKIKAKVTLSNKNKKHLPKKYGAKIRYKSSDTSIATVSESGKIKGIKKGTCTIYVYSINGLLKKVKITVK